MAVAAALSLDDVLAARRTIGGRVHRTPTLRSATLSQRAAVDVHLKAELFQRTGSFKPRGVLNKIASLTDEEKGRGVIAISAGNHAQALAYAAAQQGIDALVVMWQTASPMKVAAARGYGATVDTEAEDIPAAFERLDRLQAETGRTLVHPYDDPLVRARARSGSRSSRTCRMRRSSSCRSEAVASSPGSRRPSRASGRTRA